jgi:hypothetical protein
MFCVTQAVISFLRSNSMSFGESRLKQNGVSHHEEHSHPQDRYLPHLGTNWVVLTGGSLSIANHELVGTSGLLGYLKGSSKDAAASRLYS